MFYFEKMVIPVLAILAAMSLCGCAQRTTDSDCSQQRYGTVQVQIDRIEVKTQMTADGVATGDSNIDRLVDAANTLNEASNRLSWALQTQNAPQGIQTSKDLIYLGCFVDRPDRDMPFRHTFQHQHLTPHLCIYGCNHLNEGYKYAGLQHGNECFCGKQFGRYGWSDTTKCEMPCSGNANVTCGGPYENSIYLITQIQDGGQ